MLLTIHNLPATTQYTEIKSLLQSLCGLQQVILDNLVGEGEGMKVTVGVAEDADAAILVRKINGLYWKGQQLYVEDVRQQKKASEQPYRSTEPFIHSSCQCAHIKLAAPSTQETDQSFCSMNLQQQHSSYPQASMPIAPAVQPMMPMYYVPDNTNYEHPNATGVQPNYVQNQNYDQAQNVQNAYMGIGDVQTSQMPQAGAQYNQDFSGSDQNQSSWVSKEEDFVLMNERGRPDELSKRSNKRRGSNHSSERPNECQRRPNEFTERKRRSNDRPGLSKPNREYGRSNERDEFNRRIGRAESSRRDKPERHSRPDSDTRKRKFDERFNEAEHPERISRPRSSSSFHFIQPSRRMLISAVKRIISVMIVKLDIRLDGATRKAFRQLISDRLERAIDGKRITRPQDYDKFYLSMYPEKDYKSTYDTVLEMVSKTSQIGRADMKLKKPNREYGRSNERDECNRRIGRAEFSRRDKTERHYSRPDSDTRKRTFDERFNEAEHPERRMGLGCSFKPSRRMFINARRQITVDTKINLDIRVPDARTGKALSLLINDQLERAIDGKTIRRPQDYIEFYRSMYPEKDDKATYDTVLEMVSKTSQVGTAGGEKPKPVVAEPTPPPKVAKVEREDKKPNREYGRSNERDECNRRIGRAEFSRRDKTERHYSRPDSDTRKRTFDEKFNEAEHPERRMGLGCSFKPSRRKFSSARNSIMDDMKINLDIQVPDARTGRAFRLLINDQLERAIDGKTIRRPQDYIEFYRSMYPEKDDKATYDTVLEMVSKTSQVGTADPVQPKPDGQSKSLLPRKMTKGERENNLTITFKLFQMAFKDNVDLEVLNKMRKNLMDDMIDKTKLDLLDKDWPAREAEIQAEQEVEAAKEAKAAKDTKADLEDEAKLQDAEKVEVNDTVPEHDLTKSDPKNVTSDELNVFQYTTEVNEDSDVEFTSAVVEEIDLNSENNCNVEDNNGYGDENNDDAGNNDNDECFVLDGDDGDNEFGVDNVDVDID